MSEYEPLDLSVHCTAGSDVYGEGAEPPTGEQSFHGLPFRIGGPAGAPCYVAFGSLPGARDEPVTVPVGRAARRVLFAHCRLNSRIEAGDLPGRVVATYRFRYQDGEVAEVPIRERFETGYYPQMWGQGPFLALGDQPDAMQDRTGGDYGATGYQQTEAQQGWSRAYFLWAWSNPRPDVPLQAIELCPAGEDFLVAGITLGHADEEPFCRTTAREVRITLKREGDAGKRFRPSDPKSLSVEVDRGVAGYVYPLPRSGADAFLEDDLRGFGEEQNPYSSPAYVEVAAIPSSTLTVKQDGEELGKARWGDLEREGVAEPSERVRLEVVDTGRNWVHTTVLDDDTGKPVPCRIHFRSPQGIPYAPHGHHAHVHSNLDTWHVDVGGDVRLGQITYAYIDGKCQGWLPRGEVIVDVARGYEYEPLRQRVEVRPGQRELTLRLRRRADPSRERYFSGDTHVHFVSTQGAHLEAAGEGVRVVNLLRSQWGHLFTNTEEFTGRPSVSPDGETIVYATQENRQHLLGHLTLLGVKEPIMPWCSDGPSEAEMAGSMETTLSHWADACHAQGGTVVIPHLPNPNCEPAALIATGRADAVEMLVHGDYFHREYYRYLNCGYRLPLVGGTDKMESSVPIGLYRTYAHIPADQELTYDNWCRAVRGGNTFLSGGPLLRFTVDGQPIGSTLQLGRDGGTVEVEASAESVLPIHSLQIVQQGRVVASTEEEGGARSLRLRTRLRVSGTTWLAARSAGPGYTSLKHHDSWGRGIMAHTSPIYLACGGGYDLFDPEVASYMLTLLHGGVEYIRSRTRQDDPARVTHHHREEDHQAFLERPFLEAIAAIHQRMHDHGAPH